MWRGCPFRVPTVVQGALGRGQLQKVLLMVCWLLHVSSLLLYDRLPLSMEAPSPLAPAAEAASCPSL